MRWRRKDEGGDEAATPSPPPVVDDPTPATSPAIDVEDAWERQDPDVERVVVDPQLARISEGDRSRAVRRAVTRALAEDLGERGDLTSVATVSPLVTGTAEVVARGDGVVSGLDVVVEVFAQVDQRVEVVVHAEDGDTVTRGDVLATVSGPLRSVLTGERTALNFLCHLSGIATQTRRFVDALAGTGAVVRDTRKTTPGLRLLEKAAVRDGGGANHRVGLHDALLVKDNHVLAAGSAGDAAKRALARAGGRHVQVEVSRLDQLDQVLRAGVTDVMLDNFSPDEVRQAVRRVAGRASLEASGNITLDNVRDFADAGVDRIASGALTHSAPWLDIALDLRSEAVDLGPDTPGFGLDEEWSLADLLGGDSTTARTMTPPLDLDDLELDLDDPPLADAEDPVDLFAGERHEDSQPDADPEAAEAPAAGPGAADGAEPVVAPQDAGPATVPSQDEPDAVASDDASGVAAPDDEPDEELLFSDRAE